MMSRKHGRSSSTSCCCLEWRRRQYNSLHIVAKKLARLCKAGQMVKRAASLHELSRVFFWRGGGTEVDPSNGRVKLKGDCKHMLHRSALQRKGSLDLSISVSKPSLLSPHTDPKDHIVDPPAVSAGRRIPLSASAIAELVQLLGRGSRVPTVCRIPIRPAGHPQNLTLLWILL